jgi:type I restriction enzyme S subunit
MQSEMRPLGEFVTLVSGNTPSKANPAYWGAGTPWVSAKDMGDFWIEDAEDHLTDAGVAVASRLMPPGAVLLLARGMTLHKRVPICRLCKASTFNQDVKAVLPKIGLSPRFLPYLLVGNHDRLHERVDSAGHGTGRLNTDALLSFPVLVPSSSEQEAIADIGESIDERLRLLRQTNATLESIAQTLFKSWFIDFDPVRAKAEGREPEGMDAATAALFPAEFEESALGLIPKGWRAGILADLSALNAASWSLRCAPAEVAYVDLAGVKSNVFDSPQRYSFAEAPSRARRELRAGDTLVGTVRPGNRSFGFVAQSEPGLTGSTGFAVLSPTTPSAAPFVYLCATRDENIERLAALADGGAYPAVRPELVHSTTCAKPPEPVLEAFHSVASPLLLSIAANAQIARSLAELRDTLLPRLISGKLRLPEVRTRLEVALA